jgi:hypothetical protein
MQVETKLRRRPASQANASRGTVHFLKSLLVLNVDGHLPRIGYLLEIINPWAIL